MNVCALSHVQLFVTPWTNLPGSSLSMGFLRQEYLSGLPLPSPGDLPNPGIEPTSVASPALTDIFFTTSATWEAITKYQVPQAEWLLQYKFIFLQFWRLEVQGQGVGNVGFILRPFSLTCRQWSFPDVSTWSSLCVCSDLFLQGHQSYWVRPVLTTMGWEDPRRRKWQPTPVSLPGKSHGQRSLVGRSPWHHKELGTTERLTLT